MFFEISVWESDLPERRGRALHSITWRNLMKTVISIPATAGLGLFGPASCLGGGGLSASLKL